MKKDNLFLVISFFLFIFAIFLFLKNLSYAGTGEAAGFVNLTVERFALVNFTVDNIDWGTGSVDENSTFAVLDTMGNVVNGSWDKVMSGFVIENIGNAALSLNFSSTKNASTFIGGTNSSYQFKISNLDDCACQSPISLGTFYEMPTAGTSTQICSSFLPGKNIMFDLKLRIPYNSNMGNLSDIISVSVEEA